MKARLGESRETVTAGDVCGAARRWGSLLTAVLQKHSKQRAAMADAEQEAAASKIAAIKRGK
jgi:hypothetical protein